MMEKPWDKLRDEQRKPPLKAGEWQLTRGGLVSWEPLNEHTPSAGAVVLFGGQAIHPGICITPTSCRELGGFLVELADQLEGK